MRSARMVAAAMSIFAVLGASGTAEAGPFANFFKRLRYSIEHPDQKPYAAKTSRPNNKRAPADASKRSDAAAVNSPPNGENIKTAKASATKNTKADLQYGTPVPGRDGFVTSPFAPTSGYVDVRGFPPGTQVKDPYTGKTFLTP